MSIIVSNNAVSKLTAGLSTSATSVSITGGTGVKFPSTADGDQFYITVVNSSNEHEIMLVTARSGDDMTVVRAQESTTAKMFSVGDRVFNAITAAAFNVKADDVIFELLENHINDDTDAHDASAISYNGAASLTANNVEAALDELSTEKVQRTSDTGSAVIPGGTTAERDVTPAVGFIRFNTTLVRYEGYYGTTWGELGGGATGAGTDKIFYLNGQVVNADYSIPAGQNAMTAGDITVLTGVTVTVPSGSRWVIV